MYLWLKVGHVAAATLFAGGLIAETLMIATAAMIPPAEARRMGEFVRRWEQRVTTPSMLAVWTFGLALASSGHWFHSGWLPTKLVFVTALSALHGVQAGALRRLASGRPTSTKPRGALIVACILAIACLAVEKPF